MKKCKYKYGSGTKKVKAPIETTDRNKVQNYQDSLNTYLSGEENLKKLLSAGFKKDGKDWNEKDWKNYLNKAKEDFRSELTFQKGMYYDKNPVQYTVPNPTENTGYELKYLQLKGAPENIILNKDRFYINEPVKRIPLKTDAEFKYTTGEYTRVRSTKTLNNKTVKDTGWQVTKDTRKTNTEDRDTKVLLPLFKKPEQPYVLKKKEDKPVDIIGKNKPAKVGGETVGMWNSTLKKPVDTRVKTNVEPLNPKIASTNLTKDISLPERNITPVKVETSIKKGGKFAQYPNMKYKLNRTSQGSTRPVNGKLLDMQKVKYKKGTKYLQGVQKLQPQVTPDYNNLYNMQAKQGAKQQQASAAFSTAGNLVSKIDPISGNMIQGGNALGDMTEGLIGKKSDGTTKVGGFAANKAFKGAGIGAAIGSKTGVPIGTAIGAGVGFIGGGTYGLIKGKQIQRAEKEEIRRAKMLANVTNLNNQLNESEITSAQAYLKKGTKSMKYKSRIIETEGREPIFSPKDKNGNRKLLYYNPQGKTHAEGGEKILVGNNGIPEGSAIVTANKNKNKKALIAYKTGDKKKLENIINSMPEDKGKKAEDGKAKVRTTSGYPVLSKNKKYGKEMSTEDAVKLFSKTDAELDSDFATKKISKKTYDIEKGRRKATAEGKETYTVDGYNDNSGKPLIYSANKIKETPIGYVPLKNNVSTSSTGSTSDNTKGSEEAGKQIQGQMNSIAIPSIAEFATRAYLLSQGVENVPENYVKFNKFKYASQLDKNLAENATATNNSKKVIRNMSGGNAGNYLSNISNLTTQRLKANNEAVIQDTLARQDILNKNVNLDNEESKINTELKIGFNDRKAENRGAYNDNLIAAGQKFDDMVDTYNQNSEQTKVNNILLNTLNTGNYRKTATGETEFFNPNTKSWEKASFKKGTKKLKYKK